MTEKSIDIDAIAARVERLKGEQNDIELKKLTRQPPTINFHGKVYCDLDGDGELELVEDLKPLPETLKVMSLDSVVSFVDDMTNDVDLVVCEPCRVLVYGRLDEANRRPLLLSASKEGESMHLLSGRPLTQTQAVLALGMHTRPDKEGSPATDRDAVAALIANIIVGSERTQQDNGFHQTVATKQGTTATGYATVKNPVALNPINSWPQIDVGTVLYIVRITSPDEGSKAQPSIAFYEADGGAWKARAAELIAAHIKYRLSKEMQEAVTILS